MEKASVAFLEGMTFTVPSPDKEYQFTLSILPVFRFRICLPCRDMKLSKIHWEKESERNFSREETREAVIAANLKQRRIREILRRIEQLSWRTYLDRKSRGAR